MEGQKLQYCSGRNAGHVPRHSTHCRDTSPGKSPAPPLTRPQPGQNVPRAASPSHHSSAPFARAKSVTIAGARKECAAALAWAIASHSYPRQRGSGANPMRMLSRRLILVLSSIVVMAAESSDSDFEPSPPARRRVASSRMLSLSQSLRQSSSTTEGETSAGSGSHGSGMAPTARRLNEVVRHGLSIMNSRRHTSVASELANRFPFLSQAASQSGIRFTASSKSRRAATVRKWKITPCLLNSPNSTRVPTRDQMDRLCRQGLGTLWFDKDDQLLLSHHYNAEELHFFLTCLYPPLADKSYQLCRAGGPSHHMIVPLAIEEEEMVPSLERQFRPYFTVDMLKDKIGRKGRLYIRPLSAIDLNSLPTVSAEYVSEACCCT